MSTRADNSPMRCQIVTPERTVLDQEVTFVAVPLLDGELGILPGRAPLVARLGYGQLRVKSAGDPVEPLFVDGGFLQIRDNLVSVLTNRAIPLAEIKVDLARADLERALAKTPTTPADFDEKERAVARARAQIRLSELRPH